MVATYPEVLMGAVAVGSRVAIIGAGAIGFDVAEFLTIPKQNDGATQGFFENWGVQVDGSSPGSLMRAASPAPLRAVHVLHRGAGRPSARLGISTGWIVRTTLKRRNVQILTGCAYTRVDDRGLHYSIGEEQHILEVDNVVICAGQEPLRELQCELEGHGLRVDTIGGARDADRLDARRAIEEGYRLALEC